MIPPSSRARCSLHVVVADSAPRQPELNGLLNVLDGRLDRVVVALWTDGDPDIRSLECIARALDDLERAIGLRPAYVEITGDLDPILPTGAGSTSIVAVPAGAGRRIVKAARRSAMRTGAHLAVVPGRPAPNPGLVTA